MSAALSLPAPAKINLFLHVTGRRPDGYHTLESVFAPIDLADTIALTLRDDGDIRRTNDVPDIAPEDDLALRAAHALRRATGCNAGVDIGVTKRVPVGGGLGGGSSDAASVLIGLNHLWRTDLSRARLAELGLTLGADVPFFLGAGAAFARGIGEELQPVSIPPSWIALAVPDAGVATAAIFAAPELTRNTPSAKISVFSEGYGRNDLQAVATARFGQTRVAIDALKRATPFARMTGSGGCAFAVFATQASAHAALAALPREIGGRVVRVLERHPLAAFDTQLRDGLRGNERRP